MNRRDLFRGLAALCAAPVVALLPEDGDDLQVVLHEGDIGPSTVCEVWDYGECATYGDGQWRKLTPVLNADGRWIWVENPTTPYRRGCIQ